MTANGNEAVTLSQLKMFTESSNLGGGSGYAGPGIVGLATGDEVVTLKQLKMLVDSLVGSDGGSNKKYKIEWSSDIDASYRSNQTEAEPGSIVPCCSKDGQWMGNHVVCDSSKTHNIITYSYTPSNSADLSDLPEIVQEAINNMPEQARSFEQTRAVPPPTTLGFSWFVMPACDVYVVFQG